MEASQPTPTPSRASRSSGTANGRQCLKPIAPIAATKPGVFTLEKFITNGAKMGKSHGEWLEVCWGKFQFVS